MTLIVDGVEHVLRAGAPYRFPGEADVRCTPEGATVDFNVMTRRGHWTTEVACHELAGHGEALTGVPTGGERFVAVLTGSVAATPDAAAPVALRRYDVLQTTDPVRLTGAGLIAVVHLRPVRTTER